MTDLQDTPRAVVTQDDVHRALDYLISIEPEPHEVGTLEQYHAAMAKHRDGIERAEHTLRKFAEQIEPKTLEHMREVYYRFANLPRYLGSGKDSAVVIGCLREAFAGIGRWQN